MALKSTVKVTINNLSDARYCAGMGVDLIGFSTDTDSPFYLTPESFKDISEWLSGVEYVAEASTNNIPHGELVNYIQLKDISLIPSYQEKKIIFEGTPEQLEGLKAELKEVDNLAYLLINIDHDKEDIALILQSFYGFPILLGYDLSVKDVDSLLEMDIEGIALKGSDEDKPGLKDYDELADILESLEVDAPY